MRRGATLAEVVISLALFSFFILLTAGLYGHTFRYFRAEEGPGRIKAEGRIAMERMAKSIRRTEAVLDPEYYQLLWNDFSGIVVRENMFSTSRVVGYRIKGRQLEQIIYNPNYDRRSPGTQRPVEVKVICPQAKRLRFRVEEVRYPTLVTLELDVEAAVTPTPYKTRVNFRVSQ